MNAIIEIQENLLKQLQENEEKIVEGKSGSNRDSQIASEAAGGPSAAA